MFSLRTFLGRETLGGHDWTFRRALLWEIVTALLITVAFGMKFNNPWRWYAQAAPSPVFVIGFGLVHFLLG